VIYHEKRPKKLKTRETKYVEINNIVYRELYSGAKMVNEKDLKTKYLRSKNREFTVYVIPGHTLYVDGSFPTILMNILSNNSWKVRKLEFK
jgi:hypothetical protein